MMSATNFPTGTPQSWAQDAVRNEIKVIESSDKVPLRYRQRKVGAKGDTTREIMVSRDGNVARSGGAGRPADYRGGGRGRT
jgi:hypothetical protein